MIMDFWQAALEEVSTWNVGSLSFSLAITGHVIHTVWISHFLPVKYMSYDKI